MTTGCSAQVAGMNSPVFHDYSEVEWIPLDRAIEQWFIAGSGYSAAIQNDPTTTDRAYQSRLMELPTDATSGELVELRLGVRSLDMAEGPWTSGARLTIATMDQVSDRSRVQRSDDLASFDVDALPRRGDMLILDDLPELVAGDVVVLTLTPGDGDPLEVSVTPHRAPYGGWRAIAEGESPNGALVFETRYQRDVAVGEVVGSGLDRMTSGGSGFVVLWMLASGGLLAGIIVVSRQRVGATDGR